MVRQSGAISNAEQVANEPAIEEVQTRAFAQPLPVVGVVRGKGGGQITDLQRRQPTLGGLLRHAHIGRERRQVQFPAGVRGGQPHETLEAAQIVNARDLAQVPLEVRAQVVRKPLLGHQVPVVNARIEPTRQRLPETRRRRLGSCRGGAGLIEAFHIQPRLAPQFR